MYINLVFLGYNLSIFSGLFCVALIMIIGIKVRQDKTARYQGIRNFSLILCAISVLYFVFYYRETVLQIYEIPLFLRIIDYLLFALEFSLWLCVLGNYMEHKKNIFKVAAVLAVAGAGAGILFTALYMNAYYYIANDAARYFFICFEGVMNLLIIFAIMKYEIDFVKSNATKRQTRFTVFVSVLLCYKCIDSFFTDTGLALGKFGVSAWQLERFDPSSLIMLLVTGAMILFVFKEDFSPLFFQDSAQEEINPLEAVAEEHKLTVRECEVLKLLYEGYTNPEIAEELFISRNTVKKHVQNIYEKIGVSSRIELIHLINPKITHMDY